MEESPADPPEEANEFARLAEMQLRNLVPLAAPLVERFGIRVAITLDAEKHKIEVEMQPLLGSFESSSQPETIVITLHGIRTRGEWQKRLAEDIASAGMKAVSYDFGLYRASQLVLGSSRRKQMERYFAKYGEIVEKYPGHPISVVAHSFGTYLVARSLEKYSDLIKYDRVLFCGSIVRADYPWDQYGNAGRVSHVLNEYGSMDVWARIVAFVVSDSGQSGRNGFTSSCPYLTQRGHAEHRHSDYFTPINFREIWVKFLKGKAVQALTPADAQPRNRKFEAARLIFVLLVIGVMTSAITWVLYHLR